MLESKALPPPTRANLLDELRPARAVTPGGSVPESVTASERVKLRGARDQRL